jgi:hypothetical protein
MTEPLTYLDTSTDTRKVITPPSDTAQAIFDAFTQVQVATAALDHAMATVPSYTGQYNSIDFYGEQQEAFNRALDRFEGALCASVVAAIKGTLREVK